jgi:RecJ-like exonuclease
MICEDCHGEGFRRIGTIFGEIGSERRMTTVGWIEPCPECHGSGVVSCCEGAKTCEAAAAEYQRDLNRRMRG